MDIRWMLVICAGGGALLGAVVGDLVGASHMLAIMLAGAGGAIGAGVGLHLAAKQADFAATY